MRRRCRSRMNRGHNRVTGEAGFHGGIALDIAHLAHAHHIGIETERRHHKVFLGDIVCRIVRRSGQRMHHVVRDDAILVAPDQ